MANTKEYREKRIACKEQYELGNTDVERLSALFSVAEKNVKKWIKEGGWETDAEKTVNMEKKINENIQKALNVGLEQYINDPANTSLQSLVAILKDYQKKTKPSKELNEYIVRFQELVVDFCLTKGYGDLLQIYQEYLLELSEYMRIKLHG